MNVHPHIFTHPKYVRLHQVIGPGALHYLGKIWAFCQVDRRGEKLGKLSPVYVEMICGWTGDSGVLFGALTEKLSADKCGWIELDADGNLTVHDWNKENSNLVQNWKNGESRKRLAERRRRAQERPALPKQSRSTAPALPKQSRSTAPALPEQSPNTDPALVKPSEVKGSEVMCSTESPPAREVSWPSLAEFKTYAGMIGLPEFKAEREWHYQESTKPPWKNVGDWKKHATSTKVRWEQDGRPSPTASQPGGLNSKKPPTTFDLKQRREALQKIIDEHPANTSSSFGIANPTPEQRTELQKLRADLGALNRQIAEGGK